MATQPVTTDPWDSAENPQVRQPEYFGQVQIDMSYATLQKGVGKVPFDPAQHDVSKRVTAIDVVILPLPECNINFPVTRSLIAESREWAGIVLPSIKALGVSARELNGKYAHVKIEATGETYENKQGETKNKTTFKFLALFPDEGACRAAYHGNGNGSGNGAAPQNTTTVSPERETALKFLAVVVENAARGQTDLNIIRNTAAANIATMPMINKFFTVDSPETLALIAEKMAKNA